MILRDRDVGELQIHWIVGNTGKPAFLRGTDNALAEKAFPEEELKEVPVKKGNMTVYKGRFKSAKGTGPVTIEIDGNKGSPISVDLVVYGAGPDVEAMQAMFVDEIDDTSKGTEKPTALEPVIDVDRHNNQQIEVRDPQARRIEAQMNALPTSTDDLPLVAMPGGVNFITANQTVIRTHIAECYPNIPPGLGDYLTGQVIHERSFRPKKGDPTKTPVRCRARTTRCSWTWTCRNRPRSRRSGTTG
jgi:hypothetical protein